MISLFNEWLTSEVPFMSFRFIYFTGEIMITWETTKHEKPRIGNKALHDHIELTAHLPHGHKLKIWSHPYSDGEWSVECRSLAIGGTYCWLGTKNIQCAKERAVNFLFEITHDLAQVYTDVANALKEDSDETIYELEKHTTPKPRRNISITWGEAG